MNIQNITGHSVGVPTVNPFTVLLPIQSSSFFFFTALLIWTKDGIAFPRHALSIVKCLRRSRTYGDTMIKLCLKANFPL
jgi:hypothetical protein